MNSHNDTAVIKAGTLVLLSHGAYSDYRVSGIVRAKVDVNMVQELDAWMAAHPELVHRYPVDGKQYIDGYAFARAMLTSDKFEQLAYDEYHMGDYGELPWWYRKAKGLVQGDQEDYEEDNRQTV